MWFRGSLPGDAYAHQRFLVLVAAILFLFVQAFFVVHGDAQTDDPGHLEASCELCLAGAVIDDLATPSLAISAPSLILTGVETSIPTSVLTGITANIWRARGPPTR